jgi:tetratricopeptide (TPR) repeat protein
VIRVAIFWSGTSAGADEFLRFFDGLRRRDGGEFLEILAVEASGLDADAVAVLLADGGRRRAPLAIPVVPDPQRLLVGLFGAGDPLPQTFLIDGRGDVLFRADGFGPDVKKILEDKIARAGRLAGLGLPQAPNEVPRPGAAAEGGEAPSVSQRLERDKELRFNLSRADYFFIGGQYERGLLHYQRYLELEPGSLHALVRLAQSYDLLGDPARARAYWERVLAVSPAHEEGRRRLSELQRPAGR